MGIKKIWLGWMGLACACLLLVTGCAKTSTLEAATRMMDAFFQAVKNNDFDQAGSFFIDSATQSRQQWLDQLREYQGKLGDLQSYALQNKIINTVYSGTRYTLTYKVKYTRHDAVATFIVFEGVSGEGAHIEVMRVQSAGL